MNDMKWDKTGYFQEDIEEVQEVVEKIIVLFNQSSELILNDFKKDKIKNFDSIKKIIYSFLRSNFKIINSNYLNPNDISSTSIFNKEIKKRSREFGSQIGSGVMTFLLIIFATLLISKGLEKHGYRINLNFLKRLPYSSISNISKNKGILGICNVYDEKLNFFQSFITQIFGKKYVFTIKNEIPLLSNEMFLFGDGACPYTSGKEGKVLNENLINSVNVFFEKFYLEILIHYENEYKNLEDLSLIPDFVQILLGKFTVVNKEHLDKFPKFFEKI